MKSINVLPLCLILLGIVGLLHGELSVGDPISNGSIVRLTQRENGKNLHFTEGRATAFGKDGVGDYNDNWIIEMLPMGGCLVAGKEVTGGQRVRLRHLMSGQTLHFNSEAGVTVSGHEEGDNSDVWYTRSDGSPAIGGSLAFEFFVPNNKLQPCGGVLSEDALNHMPRYLNVANERLMQCVEVDGRFEWRKSQRENLPISCVEGCRDEDKWWVINPPDTRELVFPAGTLKIVGAWYGTIQASDNVVMHRGAPKVTPVINVENVTDVLNKVRAQLEKDNYIAIPGGHGGVMNSYFGIDGVPGQRQLVIVLSYNNGPEVVFSVDENEGFVFTHLDAKDLFADDAPLMKNGGSQPGQIVANSYGKNFTVASAVWQKYISDVTTNDVKGSPEIIAPVFSVTGAWYGAAGAYKKDMTVVTKKVNARCAQDGQISISAGSGEMNAYVCGDPLPGTVKELIIEITYNNGRVPVLFSVGENHGFTLSNEDVQALAAKGLFDSNAYWPGRRPISTPEGKRFIIVHPALLKERPASEAYLCVEPNWDDRSSGGWCGVGREKLDGHRNRSAVVE